VDNNFVESIISIAPNLFYGTSISVTLLVLSKNKKETKTQFIDATSTDFYKKVTNNNILTDEHIDRIMDIFDRKEDVLNVAKYVDNKTIAENDYNLSVSSYIEVKDNRQYLDIQQLNQEITATVKKINSLRSDIDEIINEIKA
jgi:type I restriction enzyme M protein